MVICEFFLCSVVISDIFVEVQNVQNLRSLYWPCTMSRFHILISCKMSPSDCNVMFRVSKLYSVNALMDGYMFL